MKQKIVVIVGTNASGKSNLGVKLAKKYNGEIISADSRQVFERLDLGSGKITEAEMDGVRHHLLDVRKPGEFFSMADFQQLAYEAIEDILSRGKVPFIVGGTGLYVDSVADGYILSDKEPDRQLREELEKRDTPTLYAMLKEKIPDTDIEPRNRHRVMRALERIAAEDYTPAGKAPRYDVLKLGVTWDRETLKQRIDERLDRRLEQGMVDEVRDLLAEGVSEEFMMKLGLEYRFLTRYLKGELSLEEMKEELGNAIKKFAKRQMTWFRKDPRIIWLNMFKDPATEAGGLIERFLEDKDMTPEQTTSLCEAYRNDFMVGAAVAPYWLFSEPYTSTVLRHFNSMTAENDMKPWSILDYDATCKANDMITPRYDFTRCDRLLDFAKENGIRVRFHVLVWHNQTPRWFFTEKWSKRDDTPFAGREIMQKRLEAYIGGVMDHVNEKYPGLVYAWDVVNEAIEPDHGAVGLYRTNNSPWFQTLGEEFIPMAFRAARKHQLPDQKLFYNDFNSFQTPKIDAIIDLLKKLKDNDLVDGMGMQGHFVMDSPTYDEFENAMRRYAALGLTLQITELDIHCPSDTEEMQQKLAERYAQFFGMWRRLKQEGIPVESVTFWGVSDKDSWLKGFRKEGSWSLLFDERVQPKKAFFSVVDATK